MNRKKHHWPVMVWVVLAGALLVRPAPAQDALDETLDQAILAVYRAAATMPVPDECRGGFLRPV